MPCEATSGARLEEIDGTSVLFTERATDASRPTMYHCGRPSKVAGTGTMSEANGVDRQVDRPHAR